MKIALTRSQLKEYLDSAGERDRGFVPTMGALHAGHLSLVGRARAECGTVIVSIFVNPNQFNDSKDLKNYPRTPERDLSMLETAGTDIVFMPDVHEIYPEPDTRIFDFGALGEVMEGASRPGHFNGVAQVVSILFGLVKPSKAYFGEKDFQQIAVICEMNDRMGFGTEIVPCPVVRESDGLALSSRNELLAPSHRSAAPAIYAALCKGVEKMGEMTPAQVEEYVAAEINSNPLLRVLYFNIVDNVTLQGVHDWNSAVNGARGCVAVQAGNIRLIDNVKFL